jgi:hypothetical protein
MVFLALPALASCVGRDFVTVSAHLHAAPAARSLLAGVIEMQDAIRALANSRSVSGRQDGQDIVKEWSKCIFCTPQIEAPCPFQTCLGSSNLIDKGMLQQEAIQLADEDGAGVRPASS